MHIVVSLLQYTGQILRPPANPENRNIEVSQQNNAKDLIHLALCPVFREETWKYWYHYVMETGTCSTELTQQSPVQFYMFLFLCTYM